MTVSIVFNGHSSNLPDGVLLETLPGRCRSRNNLVSEVFVESFGGFFSGQISSVFEASHMVPLGVLRSVVLFG